MRKDAYDACPKNPRINDAAVEAVAKSIKEFGFRVPLVLDKNNVIITGHTRLRSAKLLGLTEVPCIIADNLTPEQVQAYRIADNKTGEIAEWDYALLPMELKDLQNADFELSVLGFDPGGLEQTAAALRLPGTVIAGTAWRQEKSCRLLRFRGR